jgi:hypothetical protein
MTIIWTCNQRQIILNEFKTQLFHDTIMLRMKWGMRHGIWRTRRI